MAREVPLDDLPDSLRGTAVPADDLPDASGAPAVAEPLRGAAAIPGGEAPRTPAPPPDTRSVVQRVRDEVHGAVQSLSGMLNNIPVATVGGFITDKPRPQAPLTSFEGAVGGAAARGGQPVGEQAAFMQRYGYQPSSPEAQRNLETLGEVAQNFPPVIPMIGPAGGVAAGLSAVGVRRGIEAAREGGVSGALNAVAPVERIQQAATGVAKALDAISETNVGLKPLTAESGEALRLPAGFRTKAERGVPTLTAQEKLDLPRKQKIVDAMDNGFVLSPPAAESGGLAEKLTSAGGKPALSKELSHANAENVARLARRDVGLPEDTPVSHAAMEVIRAEEGKKYEVLKQAGTLKHDAQFGKDLDGVIGEIKSAAVDYPELLDNPIIKRVEGLRNPEVKFSSAVEVVKDLRDKAGEAYRAGRKRLGRAYRDSAMAVDNSMDRALTGIVEGDGAVPGITKVKEAGALPAPTRVVDPELANAVAEYRAARTRIAKTYLLDTAMAGGKEGEVNALAYAKVHDKNPNLLTGDARVIAEFAKNFGKEGLAQSLSKSQRGASFGFGDLILAALHPGTWASKVAVTQARPGFRALIASEAGQKHIGKSARAAVEKAKAAEGSAVPPTEPRDPGLRAGFEGVPLAEGAPGGSVVKVNPNAGVLGDLTPDLETVPGAGGAAPPRTPGPGEAPLTPGRTALEIEPQGAAKIQVAQPDAFPASERRAAGSEIPAVPGRPGMPDTMTAGGPAEVAASEASNAAMVTPGATEARRQQGTAEPAPKVDPRLAEAVRLRDAAPSPAVRRAVDAHIEKIEKEIKAEEAAAARRVEADELDAAAKETSDPALRDALVEKAVKLRGGKIPVGEAKEIVEPPATGRAPDLKPLPVPKVTEGQPPIDTGPVKPIPVGEAKLITESGVEPAVPAGEVKELYVDPTRPEAAAWRKEFGLGADDAQRAAQVRKALDAEPEVVEKAAKADNFVAFDKLIDDVLRRVDAKRAKVAEVPGVPAGKSAEVQEVTRGYVKRALADIKRYYKIEDLPELDTLIREGGDVGGLLAGEDGDVVKWARASNVRESLNVLAKDVEETEALAAAYPEAFRAGVERANTFGGMTSVSDLPDEIRRHMQLAHDGGDLPEFKVKGLKDAPQAKPIAQGGKGAAADQPSVQTKPVEPGPERPAAAGADAGKPTAGGQREKATLSVAEYEDGYVVEDQSLTELAGPFASRAEAEKARVDAIAKAPDELQDIGGFPTIDASLVLRRELEKNENPHKTGAFNPAEQERGVAHAREKLQSLIDGNYTRKTKDAANVALWVLDQNPNLANGVHLFIGESHPGGAKAAYSPLKRIISLFTQGDMNAESGVHEFLHHAEKMMPEAVQTGVRKEWRRKYEHYMADPSLAPEVRTALKYVPLLFDADDAQAVKAHARIREAFANGALTPEEHYQLVDPSEFFAVNASRLLHERFASRGTWRADAVKWLDGFKKEIVSTVGARADSELVKAIDYLLDPNQNTGAERSSVNLLGAERKVRRAETAKPP